MAGPVLIRGIGDVGSAVGHVLHRAGFAVAILDEPCPTAHRRGMAFVDAMYDGSARLDGVTARRVDDVAEIAACRAEGCIAALCLPFDAALQALTWSVLIDARMRKRQAPEDQRGLAPLVIGLGPGFDAGANVDIAVETSWERLGAILRRGPTLKLAGEPQPVGGAGRERLVYAPEDGVFRTQRRLGELVAAGDVVATVDGQPLLAPIAGALRGLTRDGIRVARDTKVIEVDPRGTTAGIFGLGERPRRIAEAVLSVVAGLSSEPVAMLGIDNAAAR